MGSDIFESCSPVQPFAVSSSIMAGSLRSILLARLIAPFPVACVPTGKRTLWPVMSL